MTCVMENTLVSTTVERKKRGRYGIRVIKGQEWSKEYPGMIDCGDGIFRRPILWKGGSHNRYYIQTACSQCSKDMLIHLVVRAAPRMVVHADQNVRSLAVLAFFTTSITSAFCLNMCLLALKGAKCVFVFR